MAATSVPERVRWAVETLAVHPVDRVLEIGCGRGVAISLICERLVSGRITALDRSTTMANLARRRNLAYVSSGRAVIHAAALAAADLEGERFDKAFAVNVNLFWTRSPSNELGLVKRLLTREGALCLFYEPPAAARADQFADELPAVLRGSGFATETLRTTTTGSASLLCVVARAG
jgi:cyclopropane fatty-acyl-phospholipid synthase-like methyltransferase